MAIGTGAGIDVFGTRDSVDDGSTSSIASGAFSVAGDISAWTNDDDAPEAVFTLKCQWATVTNVANKVINIYARPLNVNSTEDPPTPGASSKWERIGHFVVYAAATGTDYVFQSNRCRLPNYKASSEFEFYFENLTGQTISSGWAAWVTPVSQAPHA